MSVVFVNTTLESFTATKSGAIGTWVWEVCRAAKRGGSEPLVISLRIDAEPYPWKNTIFLDYPRHDFNEGWKRAIRKAFVLQTKIGGWYHMRHPAWCRRVGDAIEKAGVQGKPLILQNDPQLAVVLRRRFPRAFILHLFQNQNTCSKTFRVPFRKAVNVAAGVSDYTAAWNQEHFGREVKTLLSGVDQERFRPAEHEPDGPPFINFVGRTVRDKGPDLLLKAARMVARKTTNFGVQILGFTHFGHNQWDAYQEELVSLVKDLEEAGVAVRKPGFIDRNALPGELQKAQIHVHPARWEEAFGLATLEGMAVGLATVASKTGGTPEVVGDGGFLFERDSVDELAAHLHRLVTNHELRREYGQKARARAEELTWDHTWARLQEMLPG
jgi:glycosyltransferase involved in cell wall biosynthesis